MDYTEVYRKPVFDVVVKAQKRSPYSKMAQNELAKELYQLGFFNPQLAEQSLTALDLMDFEGEEKVRDKVQQGQTLMNQLAMMQQQMLMMAQALDQVKGTNMAEQIAAGITGGVAPAPAANEPGAKVEETEALGGDEKAEASNTKKARQRVAEATDPT